MHWSRSFLLKLARAVGTSLAILAAWMLVARSLLNLDEAITRE